MLILDTEKRNLVQRARRAAHDQRIHILFIAVKTAWLLQPLDTQVLRVHKDTPRRVILEMRTRPHTGHTNAVEWLAGLGQCLKEALQDKRQAPALLYDGFSVDERLPRKYIMAHFPLSWQRKKDEHQTYVGPYLTRHCHRTITCLLDDVLGGAMTFPSAAPMPSGSPDPIADVAAVKPTHRLQQKMKSHLDRQEGAIRPRGFRRHCCCQGRRSLLGIASVFGVSGLHTSVDGETRASRAYACFSSRRTTHANTHPRPPALVAAIALRATSPTVIDTTSSRPQDVPALPGHARQSEPVNAKCIAPAPPSHVRLLSAIAFPSPSSK